MATSGFSFLQNVANFSAFRFPQKNPWNVPFAVDFYFVYGARRGVKFRQNFKKHTALMTLSMLMAIVCKLSLHTNRWSDEFSFLLPAVDDDTCMKEKKKMSSIQAGEESDRNKLCNYKKMSVKLWGKTCNNVAYLFSSAQHPLPSFLPLSFRPTEQ